MNTRYQHLALIGALAAICWASPSAAEPLREAIDAHIQAAWQREKIEPAPPASDATFLRRVYLDLCGSLPTYDETKAFLDDESSDKRAKLIDRLLDDPRYAQHQADVWDMVLFGRNPPGYDADKRGGFQKWLKESFAKNVRYDKLVEAMLRAEGNTVDAGAPMFLVQYRRKPEEAAEKITQVFLGVQLQCARCHDHPFEDWKQVDFYGMAAFLARLDVVKVGKSGKLSKYVIGEHSTGDILFTGPASEQEPGKKGKPISPKFLLGDVLEEPEMPEDFEEVKFKDNKQPPAPKFSRKNALADWVANKDNPFMPRAIANRVWAQFMGRGIVHPVDDMSPYNTPSHPELLKKLTAELVAHDFDLKWYIREICNSKVYQLSHLGSVEEAKPRWFERAKVRPLSAEELAEGWRVATGYVQVMAKKGKKPKEDDRFFGITSGYMLSFFGRPNNGVGDFQGGLHEHLYLNNGQVRQLIVGDEGGVHHAIANAPAEARADRLFMSVLSRRPTEAEREKFTEYLFAEEKPHERVSEAMWALMTCSEFRFNH